MQPQNVTSNRNRLFRFAALVSWWGALWGLLALFLAPAVSSYCPEDSRAIVMAIIAGVLPILSLVAALIALYGALCRHIPGIAGTAIAGSVVSTAMLVFDGLATRSNLQNEQLPVVFAAQIADADRVVLWDWARLDHRSITGAQVRAIVRAVSTARGGEHLSAAASFGRTLEFYRGTNLLGSARIQRTLIKTAQGEYVERDKAIDTLDQSFPDEADRMTGAARLVSDVRRSTELHRLPDWVRSLSRLERRSLERGGRLPDWLSTNWPRVPWVSLGSTDDFMMLDWPGIAGILVCADPPTNFTARFITNAVPGVYVYYLGR